MSKYYKAVWGGNITRHYLEKFTASIEKKWHISHGSASIWQTEYGDFNGDGKQDILISYWGTDQDTGKPAAKPSDGQLVLLLGDGVKGFKDGTDLLPNHGRMNSMTMNSAVADFNNDGKDDVILTNHNEDGRSNPRDFPADQYAFFSTNRGEFKQIDLDLNTWGRQSFSADFNNDGRLDFAVQGWNILEDGTSDTAVYYQNKDGTYTKKLIGDDIGGNVTTSGDFDGDGEVEIASFTLHIGEKGEPSGYFTHLYEMNGDGTLGTEISKFEQAYRTAYTDDTFGGSLDLVPINKLPNGKEVYDDGIHFADTGDINGDGADDIVALHYTTDFKILSNGHIAVTKNHYVLQAYSAAGGGGLEDMHLRVKGWEPGFVDDIHLVDWNGDSHLDIFLPWRDDWTKTGTEAERVFLNDGTGNFERLNQKFLPPGINNWGTEYGDYTDANDDGIMDILVRPSDFTRNDNKWAKYSETLYLGTAQIFGPDTTHNPAVDGAAGFNENYYRSELKAHHLTIKGHMTALEHYLAVGEKKGLWGFAPGTHVYGYEGNDKIALREGNEQAEGFEGNDILVGGAGADTLSGGKGSDVFRYLSVSDSGVSPEARDLILDFQRGSDHIDLKGIDAKQGTPGNNPFDFIGQQAFHGGEAGQLRWFATGGENHKNIIVEADVTGDGVADFQINLRGLTALSEHDFAL